MALFCVGISFVTQIWEYLLLYAVLLPVSLLLSASLITNSVISRWFVRRLGVALSITAVGLGLAGVVMPPVIAAAIPALGWRGIWRSGGILIAVIVLPLVTAVVRDRPRARDGLSYLSDASTARSHRGESASGSLRWRGILARSNFWLLIFVYVPMLALYGGCGQNIAPIATSRGFSQHTAGMLLSLLSLTQLAATLMAGLLSDRFGNRLPLFALALLTAVGGLLVAFGSGVIALGFGIALIGCGGSFWPLVTSAITIEFGADNVGRVFGLVMLFLPAATVLGPFGVARTQEATGSYAPALVATSALTLLAATACVIFMRERQRGIAATFQTATADKPVNGFT
jgi:MFS family permease